MGSEGVEQEAVATSVPSEELGSAETQAVERREEVPSWRKAPAIDVGELVFGRPLTPFLLDLSTPKLVIAWRPRDRRYDYVLFLSRLLRDAYRVVHGSTPLARYVASVSDVHTRIAWLPVQGSIVVIELSSEALKSIEARVRIEERLREFVSQGPGFLVLYVDRDARLEIERIVENVFNDVACPDVIEVSIDEAEPLEKYVRVVAAYSGFIDFEELESVKSLDSISMYLEAAGRRILTELALRDEALRDRVSPCSEGEEFTRFLVRALAVKEASTRCGWSSVVTCYRLLKGFDVDVVARGRDEAIYVETLTNARLVEARIKYVASTLLGSFSRATIVIPNSVLLLFAPRILDALRDATKWGGFIELAGLDISRLKLVTYGDLIQKLTS